METDDLSHSALVAALRYEPETGAFIWLVKRGSAVPGKPAGHRLPDENRLKLRLFGRLYNAHRLAWFYMISKWPEGDIDHIDGDALNNRWKNLRDVTHGVNMQNIRSPRPNNKAGLLGVVSVRNGTYSSRIRSGGKIIHLGTFRTAREAHEAYIDAKRETHEGCTI